MYGWYESVPISLDMQTQAIIDTASVFLFKPFGSIWKVLFASCLLQVWCHQLKHWLFLFLTTETLNVWTCCWVVKLNWMSKIIWEGKQGWINLGILQAHALFALAVQMHICKLDTKLVLNSWSLELNSAPVYTWYHRCLLLYLADLLCTMLPLMGTANAQSPWWEQAPRSTSQTWQAAALCTTLLLHTPFVGEWAFTVIVVLYTF